MKISEKKFIPLLAILGIVFFQYFVSRNTSNAFTNEFGFLHLLILPLSFVLFFTLQNYSSKVLMIVIFYYQFILVSTLYLFYLYMYDDPLGFMPMDALFYHNIALETQSINIRNVLLHIIDNYDVGDIGFVYALHLIYKIPGPDPVFIAKLFNISFHLISCYLIYQITIFIFKNTKIANVSLLLFGLNPASIYFNASGLKEPLFALIVTISFYFIYKAYLTNNNWLHFIGLIFVLLTGLFRVAYPVFAILAFTVYFFFNAKGKYKIYNQALIVLICLIGLFIGFKIVETELMNKINYNVIAIVSNRLGSTPTVVDYTMLTIGGIIGPFPSFNYSDLNQRHLLQTPGNYFKIIFSFYFLVGLYFVYLKNNKALYPIVLFVAMNTIVLIGLAASLDYRFIYPYISLYIVIISYGYVYRSHKKKSYLFNELTYFAFVFLIIVAYNFR